MNDLDIKVIKEYLEDCAISDNFHYEQYQIELLLMVYDKKNEEIERLKQELEEEKEERDYYQAIVESWE